MQRRGDLIALWKGIILIISCWNMLAKTYKKCGAWTFIVCRKGGVWRYEAFPYHLTQYHFDFLQGLQIFNYVQHPSENSVVFTFFCKYLVELEAKYKMNMPFATHAKSQCYIRLTFEISSAPEKYQGLINKSCNGV